MSRENKSTRLANYTIHRAAIAEDPTTILTRVDETLAEIEKQRHLNAYVRYYKESVRKQAKAGIADWKAGKKGPISGMIIGLKDLFCYADHPVQASSRILYGFTSQITSTPVDKAIQAGGLIIGHQNCDEFGMGSANENSVYGPVANPLTNAHIAGGSSGGSAAAVKAGLCHVAFGTDTGGSVRQPASHCGIIGLKPTYGRISRYGLIAFSSSFDTVGILANTLAECALVLQVIAGKDPRDNTSSTHPVPNYSEALTWKEKKLRIAYLKDALTYEGIQPAVKKQTQILLQRLQAAGHHVAAIDFPLLRYALPTYNILTNAEAYSNLARYDGVRYGYRAPGTSSLQEMAKKTRSIGFGTEVKRRLLLGSFVLSASYQDAYYIKAQKVRRLIKNSLEATLKTYDHIILPTSPTTASKQGEKHRDPVICYLADFYTVLASAAGLPAISIPNGSDAKGLPIGLQIIGAPFKEEALLHFSHYILHKLP